MPAIAANIALRDGVSGTEHIQPSLPSKDTVQPGTSNTVVWIVAAVIGGIIVVGSIVVCTLMVYSKRRQHRRDQELHPYLTHNQVVERRKKNKVDFFGDEEQRRKHMIRKSLATRSSDSGGSGLTLTAMMDQIDRELAEIERQEKAAGPKLKDDWKKWEARVRRERSMSGEKHPATSAPASTPSGVPILEVPTPAKHRSSGRVSFANPPTSPPPRTPSPAHLPG